MTGAIRPLRMGEILDRAVRLYRRNFLQFVGIVALVQVPVTMVQILISVTTFAGAFERLGAALENPAAAPGDPFAVFGPAYFAGASVNSAVGILGFILVQGVATTALTVAVLGDYLGSPSPTIFDAYRRIRHKWLQVVGAILLALVLAIALGLWWLIPCFGWFTGGGMLLFLWYVIVPLLAPVIVVEDVPPTNAWRRVWLLARRRFWWVLGFALVLYVFNLLVVAGPAAMVSAGGQLFAGDPFDFSGSRFTVQTVAQSLTVLITGVLYLPIQVASMTLLYLDLRVRTEGLDLALSAGLLSDADQDTFAIIATSPTVAYGPLLTTRDWRNFFLLTIVVVGAILLLYALLLGLILTIIAVTGPA